MNSFLSYLALFVAGQSLFLFAIILMVSPIGKISNRLLAAFILVKFCKFMLFFFGFGNISLPPYVFVFQNLAFTTGPLLYLYVLSLVTPAFSWQRRYLWHFLPVIVATAVSLVVYDVASKGAQGALIISANDPQYLYRSIHIAVGALWFLAYLILARRLLPAYEQGIRETYSSIEALTLDWLRRILIVALLAYALIAALDVAGMLLGLENEPRRLVGWCRTHGNRDCAGRSRFPAIRAPRSGCGWTLPCLLRRGRTPRGACPGDRTRGSG